MLTKDLDLRVGETELGIGNGGWKDGGHGDCWLRLSHLRTRVRRSFIREWRDSEIQRRPRGVVKDQYRWKLQLLISWVAIGQLKCGVQEMEILDWLSGNRSLGSTRQKEASVPLSPCPFLSWINQVLPTSRLLDFSTSRLLDFVHRCTSLASVEPSQLRRR